MSLRLVIVDPGLKGYSGHPYEYDRSIRDVALGAGWKVEIYGHCDMDPAIRDELGAVPWFRTFFYHPRGRFWKWIAGLSGSRFRRILEWAAYTLAAGREFSALRLKAEPGEELLVFFPNATHLSALGEALWLRRLLSREGVRVVVFFRFPPTRLLFGLATRPLASFRRTGRLRCGTDSRGLARSYREKGLECEVFPIPHVGIEPAHGSPDAVGAPLFAYVGIMREEKGFPLLVEALEKLAAKGPLSMRWKIQCVESSGDPGCLPWKRRLETLASIHDGIVLLEQPLASEAYRTFLAEADAVALPYCRTSYAERTSGVAVEAFSLGKPVVTLPGTWIAEEAAEFGVPVVAEGEDAESLASALDRTASDLPILKDEARARAVRCRAWHSPETFFALLQAWGHRV